MSRSTTKKIAVVVVGVIGLCGAASFFAYIYLWIPFDAKRKAVQLPDMPKGVILANTQIPALGAGFQCNDLATDMSVADLQQDLSVIREATRQNPEDLCTGNHYREAIRYLNLRTGRYVISPQSLPATLAHIAKDSESATGIDLQNGDKTTDPEKQEPVSLFHQIAHTLPDGSATVDLQLGLAYVDLMIHEGGREQKARLSSHSIESLSAALKRQPYMVGALYARGLNYLYWPTIAGKLPLAIRDLKLCISLSRLTEFHERPPIIFAEAYLALGDAYVKLADTSFRSVERRALLDAARWWWAAGLSQFPQFGPLEERLAVEPEQLPSYMDAARGLETYINTDLDLLWSQSTAPNARAMTSDQTRTGGTP